MRGILVVLLIVLAACRGPAGTGADDVQRQASDVQLDDTVNLELGQSTRITPAGLILSFDAVLADSRCPRDVTCVWEGSVRVRLTLALEAGTGRSAELESGTAPRFTTIGAYTVTLLPEVEPVKGAEGTYRIALRVTGGA